MPKTWESCIVDGVPTLACLEIIFERILNLSSSLILLVLFVMFVWGAIKYLTSGGNPEKIQEAQGTIKYAFIGVMLYLGSYLILNIIQFLFLGDEFSLFEINFDPLRPTPTP